MLPCYSDLITDVHISALKNGIMLSDLMVGGHISDLNGGIMLSDLKVGGHPCANKVRGDVIMIVGI